MPNVNDMFPTKYLHWQELKGTEPLLTIDRVEMEQMMGNGLEPVLYFYGKKKGVVLNKTNGRMIAASYGPATENWNGKEIVLYGDPTVMYGAQQTGGLRMRMPNGPAPAPANQAPVSNQSPAPADTFVAPANPATPATPAPLGNESVGDVLDGDGIPF